MRRLELITDEEMIIGLCAIGSLLAAVSSWFWTETLPALLLTIVFGVPGIMVMASLVGLIMGRGGEEEEQAVSDVLVCMPVALGGEVIAGSCMVSCASCDQKVWESEASRREIPHAKRLCIPCLLAMGGDLHIMPPSTAAQLVELRDHVKDNLL